MMTHARRSPLRLVALTVLAALAAIPRPATRQDAAEGGRTSGQARTQATSTTPWTGPRTAWGDPDLQGYWHRGPRNSFNVEGHPGDAFAGAVKGWIIDPADGKIPYHSWAATKGREGEFYRNYLDPHIHGVLPGPPRGSWLEHGATQIIQLPRSIVFKMEVQHFYRVIHMDGRPHPPDHIKFDIGHSVGHWEGNTLIVDVRNLSARNWLDLAGNFYSDAAHVVERFTVIDPKTIRWEATIDDPYVYTRPWTLSATWPRQDEPYEQIEEAYREGERDRFRLREALPAGAIERETLARYPPMTRREAQRQLEDQQRAQR